MNQQVEDDMRPDTRTEDAVHRLRRIEGQVRGIQRMLEQCRECGDVLTQLMAIRSGLDEVSAQIIDIHIDRCVLDGVEIDESKRTALGRALRLMSRFPDSTAARETNTTAG